MTPLANDPAPLRLLLGLLLGASVACLSLEPLSSYSEGEAAQGTLPVAEPETPAPEPASLPEPAGEPEPETPVTEGPPGDGEISLEPALQPEPEAPAVEPTPSCVGPGEFASADGTSCYRLSSESASWPDAFTGCESWGGGLVIVDSREEDEWLAQHADSTFWIGAGDFIQEGQMAWIGGAPLSYENWGAGEPNDFQGREDCVVKGMPDGFWNDLPCRNLNAYMCERAQD